VIKSILKNELTYIFLDMLIGSIVAFLGILTYGRTKKIAYLFFVMSSFFLYVTMVFRVLKYLGIFVLSEFLVFEIPLYQHMIDYFPYLFLAVGFSLLLREN